MFRETKEKLLKIFEIEKPGQRRAKMVRLINLRVEGDIAQTIESDHRSIDGVVRDCQIMLEAGAAKYEDGWFIFEDGSAIEL